MKTVQTINHVLPGQSGDDDSWFYRQNEFEQQEILRQVSFKRKYFPELGNGKFSKLPQHTYPHILPDDLESLAFYEPIANPVLDYLQRENIALHSEALNLKSSQVACFNFLFPLRQNLDLATRTFGHIYPELFEVTGIEFEYTGPSDTTQWLGEPEGGKRGQNRTSIDAAIFWIDWEKQRHVSLTEWKYTEHNFGVCSAFTKSAGDGKLNCLSLSLASTPEKSCILTSGKRHCSRRYWEHISSAGISLESIHGIKGCPFQGPFYQLMRQFLLAYHIQRIKEVDQAEVISISFAGNNSVLEIPSHLKAMVQNSTDTVIDLWNRVLKGTKPMRHIAVEELMTAVDQSKNYDPAWREYLRERYGV